MSSRGQIDPKLKTLVKKAFSRNMSAEVTHGKKIPYRNVVSMAAKRRFRPEIPDGEKVRLQITPEKIGMTRSEMWHAMLAEFDGRQSGIHVDGSMPKPTHSLLGAKLN